MWQFTDGIAQRPRSLCTPPAKSIGIFGTRPSNLEAINDALHPVCGCSQRGLLSLHSLSTVGEAVWGDFLLPNTALMLVLLVTLSALWLFLFRPVRAGLRGSQATSDEDASFDVALAGTPLASSTGQLLVNDDATYQYLPAHIQPLEPQLQSLSAPFLIYFTALLMNFDSKWQQWWQDQKKRIPLELLPTYYYCRETRKAFIRHHFRRTVRLLRIWAQRIPCAELWGSVQSLRSADGDATPAAQHLSILFTLLKPEQQAACIAAHPDVSIASGFLPAGQTPFPTEQLSVTLEDSFKPPSLAGDVFTVYDPKSEQYVLMKEEDILLNYYTMVLDARAGGWLETDSDVDPVKGLMDWLVDGTKHPFSAADLVKRDTDIKPKASVDRNFYGTLGGSAAVITIFARLPIDCIRLNQQVRGSTILTTIQSLTQVHGWASLWSGVGPAVITSMVYGALMFTQLERQCPQFMRAGSSLAMWSTTWAALGTMQWVTLLTSMLLHPLAVATVVKMIHPEYTQDWIWVLGRVFQKDGLRGMYHGLAMGIIQSCSLSICGTIIFALGRRMLRTGAGHSRTGHSPELRRPDLQITTWIISALAAVVIFGISHAVGVLSTLQLAGGLHTAQLHKVILEAEFLPRVMLTMPLFLASALAQWGVQWYLYITLRHWQYTAMLRSL